MAHEEDEVGGCERLSVGDVRCDLVASQGLDRRVDGDGIAANHRVDVRGHPLHSVGDDCDAADHHPGCAEFGEGALQGGERILDPRWSLMRAAGMALDASPAPPHLGDGSLADRIARPGHRPTASSAARAEIAWATARAGRGPSAACSERCR